MSLLFPFFLAGALFVVGPIVFHLIRRIAKNRTKFSATQFLEACPPKIQKRSRIQNPWLLLLRCLIILLLIVAFSRPYFTDSTLSQAISEKEKLVILLIDESASMHRDGLWEAAKGEVLQSVSQLGKNDRFALFAVSDLAESLLKIEQWENTPQSNRKRFIEDLLETRTPSWNGGRLDLGIEAALEEVEQFIEMANTSTKIEIKLISDFSAGSKIAGLSGREWPQSSQLELIQLEIPQRSNLSMQWLGWNEEKSAQRKARILVNSNTHSSGTEYTLTVRDALSEKPIGKPQSFKALANDKRTIQIDIPVEKQGPFVLELNGDETVFDNFLYIAPTQPRKTEISYLGDHPFSDPNATAFYLQSATKALNDPIVSIQRIPTQFPEKNLEDALSQSKLIIIDRNLSSEELPIVRSRISDGAYAVLLLEEAPTISTAIELSGIAGMNTQSTTRNDLLFGSIDFKSPQFSLFADPQYSDFTRIHFWNPVPLSIPINSEFNVLARFDDDSIAVVEKSIGSGSLLIWGSGWSPKSSQWVLSSKFIPWLQNLIQQSIGGYTRPTAVTIGDHGLVSKEANALWKSIQESDFKSTAPSSPGLYQIREGTFDQWVAFQSPSEESITHSIPLDAWEQIGVPIDSPKNLDAKHIAAAQEEKRWKKAVELEGQQQLWRWAILLALAALALESIIAIRIQKQTEAVSG